MGKLYITVDVVRGMPPPRVRVQLFEAGRLLFEEEFSSFPGERRHFTIDMEALWPFAGIHTVVARAIFENPYGRVVAESKPFTFDVATAALFRRPLPRIPPPRRPPP